MQRYRWIVMFMLVILVVSTAGCGTTWDAKNPKAWIPRVNPKTRKILDLPFKKIITTRALLPFSPLFDCLRKGNEPAQPVTAAVVESPVCETVVRFACSTVYDVELIVQAGDMEVHVNTVDPRPTIPLDVQSSTCILWRVTARSGGTAMIDRINFIDTGQDVTDTGKALNDPVIADQCYSTDRCVIFIGLKEGTYRYQAVVSHEGIAKVSEDPDIKVSCSDCGDIGLCSTGVTSLSSAGGGQ
jgi:hypothetical protein